ncbi:hypothetical protein BGX29_009042 [Mortierella sp. GBA35]|nr:hypothetical protein BGX29_009042 [Mortierella sp. GBA35]
MCDETSKFPVPIGDGGMTLGDIYERTPKDLISKVMLEEKVFDTWHSGRMVLLGDACHKLNPAGGHGAVTAIHDAVALANLIYAMPTTTSQEITKMFEEYQAERHPAAVESYENSQLFSKIMDRGIGGSAMFIAASMLSLLDQLDIIDEFVAIAKQLSTFSTNREFQEKFSCLDYSIMEAL